MPDINLLEFLENHLTDRRKELFKKVLSQRTRHFTVALENIYQSHNASAVIRSCECFGIQDVYIIEKENSFKANTGVVMGADKWIGFHYHKDSIDCINHLKNKGYRVIATTPHPDKITGTSKNDQLLEEFDISEKTAFFFGEESVGLSDDVIANADGFLKIPMFGFTESFNISVTVALVLHHLTMKLRKSENIKWKLSEEEMIEKRIDWAIKSITKGEELVKYYYNRKTDDIKKS